MRRSSSPFVLAVCVLVLLLTSGWSYPPTPAAPGEVTPRTYLPLVYHTPNHPYLLPVGELRDGGMTYALDIQDHYAYIGAGDTLMVVDIADPAHPVTVGQSPNLQYVGRVRAVRVVGKYAYVALNRGGLRIVDISRPSLPVVVGSFDKPQWEDPNNAQWSSSVAVAGHYAYLGTLYGLYILDVQRPDAPVEVGHLSSVGYSVEDIRVVGERAYITSPFKLVVLDVSDPGSPMVLGQYTAGAVGAAGVDVTGSYAYLADGALKVIDVSTPATPTLTSVYTPTAPLKWWSVSVAANRAYLAGGDWQNGEGTLNILDVSDPANPTLIGRLALPNPGRKLALSGNHVFVADSGRGLRIVDVTTPSAPHEAAALEVLGDTYGRLTMSGSRALIYEYKSGIDGAAYDGWRLLDMTDPARPTTTAVMPGVLASGLAQMDDRYAYFGCSGQLEIWDLADMTNPVKVTRLEDARLQDNGSGTRFAIHGHYIYWRNGATNSGLVIIDISDPAHAAIVGEWNYHMNIDNSGFVVAGDGLYTNAYDYSLVILDLSNPTGPQVRATLPNAAGYLAVDYPYLYSLKPGSTTQIFDVSTPDTPRLVNTYAYNEPSSGYLHTVTASNGYLCVWLYNNAFTSLRIVDMHDPLHPREVNTFANTSGSCSDWDGQLLISGYTQWWGQTFHRLVDSR